MSTSAYPSMPPTASVPVLMTTPPRVGRVVRNPMHTHLHMLTYWKDLDSAQKCCNTVPVTDKIIYMYIFYVQHLLPGIKCLLPEKKNVFVTRFKCIHGRKQMYFYLFNQ